MVAYSFKSAFIPDIQAWLKMQTVRGNRIRRHARPGEPVQLYTAMRTRHCRKILDPDPVCSRVEEIDIDVGRVGLDLMLNGIPLDEQQATDFAIADGFRIKQPDMLRSLTPLKYMRRFWVMTHGYGLFEGVVIHWQRPDAPPPLALAPEETKGAPVRTLQVTDAGEGCVYMTCTACGHETGWIKAQPHLKDRHGRVCPKCKGVSDD
tara:strand:+ start:1124 stop:1741 length:618 start_codon:yes stop_codon:yes gene_type:complete